jgi:3-oxoacyl-[acyl-carrier protein] reductase
VPRLTSRSRSVHGRVVLVTGAASGMGRAIAHLFADEGAKVAVTDRDARGVDIVAQEIVAAGSLATGWTLDVADREAIVQVVDEVALQLGPVDILVNDAGVSIPVAIDAPDDEFEQAWATTIAVNLTAQARMVRACLPHLERNREGRVVNIASTEGLGATPFISPYTASKHGVVGLTRSLACELGPRGVTVNCVCPGPITTAMTAPIPDDAKERYARRRVPLRRYGDPEEVAQMVLNLALPASSFVTGAVVTVDGGLTAKIG